MNPADFPSRKVLLVSALVLLFAVGGCGTAASAADFDSERVLWDRISVEQIEYADDQGDGGAASGRYIDGNVNINTFAPEDRSVTVDAQTVNLRQVFEDLGPIATLWYQHVQTLSNPFFEGRVPESRGMEFAKQYIEFYFQLYGLEPAFPAPGVEEMPGGATDAEVNLVSYRQPFTYNQGGARMRTQVASAKCAINGVDIEERDNFTVLGISGTGHVTAPVSFVGYGIEDGEDGYTSFDEDTDLTGRIALLLRYEPLDAEGSSQWSRARFSRHSSMAAKLRNLRDRNAAGIILVNPPGVQGGSDRLETMGRSMRFGPPMTIPAIQVTEEVADRMVRYARQGSLMDWRRRADVGQIRTAHLEGVQVTLAAETTRTGARAGVEAENVGAILRGKGALADEWIIVGGHSDHVGFGDFGTSSPANRGKLHPGADDNASGTAGVLILARTLSERYAKLPEDAEARSILFVAFSAEESGLHGSRHFVSNMSVPADKTSVMVNMDMIGRVRDRTISLMGAGTGEGLAEILKKHVEKSELTVHATPGTSGRSDDANFVNAQIPAVHFFSGLHPEYHAPGDHAYTVNPAGASELLRLVHNVTLDFAQQPHRMQFTRPGRPSAPSPDRGYAPVRLGIQPGMGADPSSPGVLIEAVSPGLPAEQAGIQAGDTVIGWGGEPLEGMSGLVANLRKHQPGDEVTLTILRNDEEMEVTVKFPRD